jgi:putative hydrolase of the HAD superfamily
VVAGVSDRRFSAVVFDLFGTLVPEFGRDEFYDVVRTMAVILDADPVAFLQAWDATAIDRQTGRIPSMEENVRVICARLGVTIVDPAMARAMSVRAEMYERSFHPRIGAVETLREVKKRGYPTGLVSMCAPDTPALWRACPLAPFVDAEVFSSEVGLRKPDPEIYRLVCDRLGIAPEECLYCGDGAYGELSGAAAVGMTPFLIADPTVDHAEQLRPEPEQWSGASVADLRELLELLPAVR